MCLNLSDREGFGSETTSSILRPSEPSMDSNGWMKRGVVSDPSFVDIVSVGAF